MFHQLWPASYHAHITRLAVSKAKILASNEMYIKSGSDINLTCVARQAPLPPLFIYWYKNGNLINHSNRGGINIITERLSRTSKLVITRATTADSGNYTCAPGDSGKSCITSQLSYLCHIFCHLGTGSCISPSYHRN